MALLALGALCSSVALAQPLTLAPATLPGGSVGSPYVHTLAASGGTSPYSTPSVTFAAPASGASGTFAASATVTPNINGVAQAPAFTANGIAGSYAVTASVAGASVPTLSQWLLGALALLLAVSGIALGYRRA